MLNAGRDLVYAWVELSSCTSFIKPYGSHGITSADGLTADHCRRTEMKSPCGRNSRLMGVMRNFSFWQPDSVVLPTFGNGNHQVEVFSHCAVNVLLRLEKFATGSTSTIYCMSPFLEDGVMIFARLCQSWKTASRTWLPIAHPPACVTSFPGAGRDWRASGRNFL